MGYYPHNIHFLWFAASMEGRGAVAVDAARKGARRNKSSRMVVTVPQRWDAMDGYPSRIGP
jgi:hypothetical protein